MVVALRNLPTINLDELPRMGDFYELCIAAGIPNFESAYAGNIETGNQAAVEASPLAAGILSLLDTCNGYWHGTTTELIRKLQELDPTSKDFQKLSARSVGRKLASCLKGDLASVGVEVDQGKSTNGQRYLILSRVVEFEKTMPPQTPTLDPAPSLNGNPVEKQSPPIALHDTPVQNNGATAVSSTPSSTSAPVKPEVAALQSDNGRVQRTTDDPVIDRGWYRLLDACCEAGVSHVDVRAVLAEATGVAPGDVERVPLTREQYNRALEYIRRWPSRTYAHHQPEPSPSRRREEEPKQTSFPPDSSASRGFKPRGAGKPPVSPSTEGIPPWLWER
jgi:hypothetical protein